MRRPIALTLALLLLPGLARGAGTRVYDASFSHADTNPVAGAGSTTGVQETVNIGSAGLLYDTEGNSFCTRSGHLSCTQDGTYLNDLQWTGTLSGADYAVTVTGDAPSGLGVIKLRRQANNDGYYVIFGQGSYVSVYKQVSGSSAGWGFAGVQDPHTAATYQSSLWGATSNDVSYMDGGTGAAARGLTGVYTVTCTISGSSTTTITVVAKNSAGAVVLCNSYQDTSSPITAAGRPALQRYGTVAATQQQLPFRSLQIDDLSTTSTPGVFGTIALADSGPSGNVLSLTGSGGNGTIGYTVYRHGSNPDAPITDSGWSSVATGTLSGGAATVTDNPGAGTLGYYRAIFADTQTIPSVGGDGRYVGIVQYGNAIAIVHLGDSIDGAGGWIHAWANSNTPNSGVIYRTDLARPTAISAPPAGLAVATPTVNVTGGGSTGGLLAAGTYSLKVAFNAAGMESMVTTPTSFTVASGNIPQVTLPAYPWPYTQASVFIGTNPNEVLYKQNITGSSVNLDAAVPTMTAPTLAASGTGNTLAAGSHGVAYCWVDSAGNQSLMTNVTAQTVTAGQLITATIPAIPSPWVAYNLYKTPVGNAGGFKGAYLYASALTGTSQTLAAEQAGPPSVTRPLAPRSGNDTSPVGSYLEAAWVNGNGVQDLQEAKSLITFLGNRKIVQLSATTPGNQFASYANAAVSGGASSAGLDYTRAAYAISYASNLVGASNVIISVKLGTNSALGYLPNWGLTPAETANFAAMMTWLKATGCKIVLHSPGFSTGNGISQAVPQALIPMLDAATDGTQVFKGDRERFNSLVNNPMNLTDGKHPINQGSADAGAARGYATYRALFDPNTGGAGTIRPRRPVYFVAPPTLTAPKNSPATLPTRKRKAA